MKYSDEDIRRLESYANVHLRKKTDLPDKQKIPALEKKRRSKLYQLLLNIVIILFFAYSYFYDITSLGDLLFYILVIVFLINVIMLIYQRKQIDELIGYYQYKIDESS
jgi:amino acid permease